MLKPETELYNQALKIAHHHHLIITNNAGNYRIYRTVKHETHTEVELIEQCIGAFDLLQKVRRLTYNRTDYLDEAKATIDAQEKAKAKSQNRQRSALLHTPSKDSK